VPVPSADVLGQALLIVLFVLLSRVISVVPTAYFLGNGLYAGMVTALNLAQISEFSLVILTLGAGYGHISERVSGVVLTAMLMTSLLSPYLIAGNDRIARWLVRPFARVPATRGRAAPAAAAGPPREIVLLGHFRIAQAVLDLVEVRAPQLKARITLVDYDANRAHGVIARGFRWEYGDLANPDALEHLGIEEARVVVTTISDTFLKGISTRRLVGNLRRLAPRAVIVMTGEERTDLEDLLRAGADHVLIPGEITGERILDLLRDSGEAEPS